MRRKRLILAIVAVITALAPVLATAGPASAATSQIMQNASTAHLQGDSGGVLQDNVRTVLDFYDVGTVSNSGEWPFTPGKGFNATYSGDNVWVVAIHGASTATCLNVTTTGQPSYEATFAQNTCSSAHPYAMLVQTRAPGGESGWLGLVDVGLSDQTNTGEYLLTQYANGYDVYTSYCTCDALTYKVVSS